MNWAGWVLTTEQGESGREFLHGTIDLRREKPPNPGGEQIGSRRRGDLVEEQPFTVEACPHQDSLLAKLGCRSRSSAGYQIAEKPMPGEMR
jgi:hypothetical protein